MRSTGKVPQNWSFKQYWQHIRWYSQEPRIVAYLYGPQERIECITNDCYDNGQRKFLVHWGDTYMYAQHIALHEQDGYKAKKHTRCPTAAKLHGPIGRLQIKKVEWEPSWEPADIGIPQDMIDALDEARNAGDCINLARANCRRLDQDKSNIERQGHWPALKSKNTSVLLHDPTLTTLIDINPMDTVNPDQDIAPTFEHVISKMHGNMPPAGKPLANVYTPSGKLCGTITFERLQILYHTFTQSQQNQPEVHQQHHNPTFEHALARLLSRYSDKHTLESKTTRTKNHRAIPDEYMKAIVDGLSITTERFASPLNFNVASNSYCSMYSEDRLFGATHDAYSHNWQGSSQASPEYEAKDMEKALRWAIFSAQETDEPVLTAFVLPDWAGTAYLRWMSHPLVQEITTIKKTQFRFKDPRHWATGKEFSSHAKWDIKFLIVANTTGLQRFVKQETLQAAFVHASALLQHPQPRIRQLRNAVTAASSLQGLYPPAGFAKAAKDMNILWTSVKLPTEATLQQALHTDIVKETELLHCPQDIIYTDGSKREMHTFGTVTGSGVYRQAPTAALQLKVHPIGQGMLNTINRAELVAILVALRECRPYKDECIATDSRCSMQKINKHLRAPAQTKDDCHQSLLQAITTSYLVCLQDCEHGSICKWRGVRRSIAWYAVNSAWFSQSQIEWFPQLSCICC